MNYRHYKIALIILTIINFLIPIGFFPLFDYDEGAFSEATREMIENKDYITTYLNGELRFDKPIFIYWLQAISIKIFGLNEFALRFPSSIAAIFWALSIYLFTKKYFSEKIAIIATLFMISSLQINMIAKAAIADSLLNLNITLSLFFTFAYIKEKREKFLLLAYFFIAIGTLTKGPVAIMIPLITTFLFMLIKRDLKEFFNIIFNLKGILIFLIIAMPWYIIEYIKEGQNFIDGFFLKHNLERFNSSLEGHSGKYYYFFIVIIIGLLPFSGYIINVFKNIKKIIFDDRLLFLFIWFTFVFIFFSFSNTKLPHYIIYGYSGILILMAYFLKDFSKLNLIFVLIFILFLIFLPDIALLIKNKIKDSYVIEIINHSKEVFDFKYKIAGLITLIITLFTIFIKDNLKKLFILGATFSIFINFFLTSAYAKLSQNPIKEAALFAKNKNLNVIMHNKLPTFLFYYQNLSKKDKAKSGDVVLLKQKSINKFKNYKILYKKYGIYLIKVK